MKQLLFLALLIIAAFAATAQPNPNNPWVINNTSCDIRVKSYCYDVATCTAAPVPYDDHILMPNNCYQFQNPPCGPNEVTVYEVCWDAPCYTCAPMVSPVPIPGCPINITEPMPTCGDCIPASPMIHFDPNNDLIVQ